MITLYDHIQELRSELRSAHLSRRERTAITTELAQCQARQVKQDSAFDAALELFYPTGANSIG